MPVFQKQKQKKQDTVKKVIGAYLPLDLLEYLTLYAISTRSSSASTIENLLNTWKHKMENEGISIEILIDSTIDEGINSFKRIKAENGDIGINFSFDEFITEMDLELRKKKITEPIIKKIIKGVKNEKKKATGN